MSVHDENAAIVAWLLKLANWNDLGASPLPSYINVEFNIDSPDGDLRAAILREIQGTES